MIFEHPLGAAEHSAVFVFPDVPDAEKEGEIPDLCVLRNEELARVDPRANAKEGLPRRWSPRSLPLDP